MKWIGNKRMKWIGNQVRKCLDFLLNVVAAGGLLLTAWVVFVVTTFATFSIPSSSMEPALQPGDRIVVNKWVMGARIFDIDAAAAGERVRIRRLPGFGRLKRNDVVVFNFPYTERWDSIGLNLRRYYVKRCVGLPGDTVEIRSSHYRVRGVEQPLGHVASQDFLEGMFRNRWGVPSGLCVEAFPMDSLTGWTIREFGPLAVPRAGQKVRLDTGRLRLYRQLIEWETERRLTVADGRVLLGDSVVEEYTFGKDYCFVAGDRTENSQDSRYWGLLPVEFIVGKATRILWAHDPLTGKMRWRRLWKRID